MVPLSKFVVACGFLLHSVSGLQIELKIDSSFNEHIYSVGLDTTKKGVKYDIENEFRQQFEKDGDFSIAYEFDEGETDFLPVTITYELSHPSIPGRSNSYIVKCQDFIPDTIPTPFGSLRMSNDVNIRAVQQHADEQEEEVPSTVVVEHEKGVDLSHQVVEYLFGKPPEEAFNMYKSEIVETVEGIGKKAVQASKDIVKKIDAAPKLIKKVFGFRQ